MDKLKKFSFDNNQYINQLNDLKTKKNQLEIEKGALLFKFKKLNENYDNLKLQLDYLEKQNKEERKREKIFEHKIDELNQETDNLIQEVDKWQT